ncbi:indole-3-glycerol phosphate synthase TrpC [Rhodohalobacter sp. SW132]|uniref:indole-3-glycerol phosphate synthase TrpC n=1 Tax=Rhodohalobacter sp. SW132 TaxID=2293433 RepID=UPI000E28382D|nr:indole-3-glycerol phosphate synthase TrpC [Rhodohalobacter sp. SW132]REL38302.1 indole-3-glycerol phosphate synthase TrpC [Rhodohalobacter sp. SW132]
MASILDEIVHKTQHDLNRRKRDVSLKELESFAGFEKQRRSLVDALSVEGEVSIIAEVKKGSPSKGIIRQDFNPKKIAEQYISGGAAAISVLTDEPFFMGSPRYLAEIAEISPVPLLRKDFLVDPYQIKEAAAIGADAVLLIATICEGSQLSELLAATKEFGLEALVECYHEEEVDSLNWKEIDILGVNNRDLKTFTVDLHRGVELLKKAPESVIKVSESGLKTAADLAVLHNNGIDAALIGEQFMRQDNPGDALKKMIEETKKLTQI